VKRLFLICLTLILVITFVVVGCTAPAPAPKPAPAPAPAPVAQPPIKIGMIYGLTGPNAVTGQQVVNSVKLLFQQRNYEVAGRKIELVIEDDAYKPEVGVDKARKLVENDKVAVILGPTSTGIKMSTGGYMDKAGIPQVIDSPCPLAMAQLKWSIWAGGSEPMSSSSMGKYAFEQMNVKTINTITGDWVAGRGFMGAFTKTYTNLGGKIVSEQYPPFDATDFASYFTNFKDADAVVSWFSGSPAITFLSQYEQFGVRKRMPLMAAFHGGFFAPYVLKALPPAVVDAMIGEKCAALYSDLLNNDANKQFVAAYKAAYNSTPGDTEALSYVAAQTVYEALKATNGDTTPAKLKDAILAVDFQSPLGRQRFEKGTVCAMENVNIMKIDKKDGVYDLVPIYTYENVPKEGY
jgi:branched-chain amino acid transport system substrate-binding protein